MDRRMCVIDIFLYDVEKFGWKMFFSLIFQDLPMEAAEAIVAKSKDKTSPEKTLGVNH